MKNNLKIDSTVNRQLSITHDNDPEIMLQRV